jgi:hypothetical protein
MIPKLNKIAYSQGHVSPQHHLHTLTVWPISLETSNSDEHKLQAVNGLWLGSDRMI